MGVGLQLLRFSFHRCAEFFLGNVAAPAGFRDGKDAFLYKIDERKDLPLDPAFGTTLGTALGTPLGTALGNGVTAKLLTIHFLNIIVIKQHGHHIDRSSLRCFYFSTSGRRWQERR